VYVQVWPIAIVTKAVALGDLFRQIEVDARGENLDLKNMVMVITGGDSTQSIEIDPNLDPSFD
jgi:hypothetical protein